MSDIELPDTEEAKNGNRAVQTTEALPTQSQMSYCRRVLTGCTFQLKTCIDLTWEAPSQVHRRKRLPLGAMSKIKFVFLALLLEIFAVGVGGVMDFVAFNGSKSYWIWSVPVWMILVVVLLSARLALSKRGAAISVDLYDAILFFVLFVALHVHGFQIRGAGDTAFQMVSSTKLLLNSPLSASNIHDSATFFDWLNQLVNTFACGSFACAINDGKLLIIAGFRVKMNVQEEFASCYPTLKTSSDFLSTSECALSRAWATTLTFPPELNVRYTDGTFEASYGPWSNPDTVGEIDTYPANGFELQMSQNRSIADEQVQFLITSGVLMKPETRAVFVEFPVFSVVLGRWIYIRELFEVGASGAWVNTEAFFTGLMPRTSTSVPYGWPSTLCPISHPQTFQFIWSLSFLLVMCEIMEGLVLGWHLALQIKHIVWYGLVLVLFSLLSVTLASQTYITASFPIDSQYVATSTYFFKLAVYLSLSSLCMWLMCLKYLNWLPGLGIVTQTMRQSAPDLAVLGVATALMIGGFTFLLHFAWGDQVSAFSTLKKTLFSILRAFTGGLETSEMPAQNYATFCYVLFMLLITFFALTMLIAVISDAFVVVQSAEREKMRALQEKIKEGKLSLEQWLTRPPTHTESCYGTMNLVIWHAESIQTRLDEMIMSPFVEVSVCSESSVEPLGCRTQIVQNSPDPHWQEKFVLPIKSDACKIKFALHNSAQDKSLLGQEMVDVSSLVPGVFHSSVGYDECCSEGVWADDGG